jgi:DNA-binding transcriptional LysR family regulator
MELYQLRTFAAVAEFGSLTQAADRLHLSQPAASAQIKILEDEFGVALFERRPSGLVLTTAGASLLPEVKNLLAIANQVVSHAKSLSGRAMGPVRFATLATVSDKSLLRIGEMMKLIVTRHPHLDVELHHRSSRYIVAAVSSGKLDLGMALGTNDIPNVERIILKELTYRIVAPRAWGEGMRRASWKRLATMPWISAPKGGSHDQMAQQLFKQMHRQPDGVIEADSEVLITSLVRAGVGLGLMREDLAKQADADKQVYLVRNGRATTYLQLLHRSGRENDRSIRAVLDVVRELWPQDEPADDSEPIIDEIETVPVVSPSPRRGAGGQLPMQGPLKGPRSAL